MGTTAPEGITRKRGCFCKDSADFPCRLLDDKRSQEGKELCVPEEVVPLTLISAMLTCASVLVKRNFAVETSPNATEYSACVFEEADMRAMYDLEEACQYSMVKDLRI